ncbi:MAG: hypothetical protein EAZ57_08105 [Cytophagales bacterium]|nr:MAG: hypothetical protein EAZ67_09180 [Cytophagales bacterium]TAF60295.1 MAG: hypothetical protein EAZ57_08105 [Cytophagales bacterium]
MVHPDNEILKAHKKKKYQKLFASIGIDLLGLSSYFIPALGEMSDTVVAPISALLTYLLYKSVPGALFNFSEEALPFTDFVPTATLLWLKEYVMDDKKAEQISQNAQQTEK